MIEFIEALNKIEEDTVVESIKTLYHSVFTPEAEKFDDENGIKRDSNGFIYLSEKPIIYDKHKFQRGWTTTYAVYEITIPDNTYLWDWRDIWEDNGDDKQYDETNPFYIYMKDIPLQYMRKIYKA